MNGMGGGTYSYINSMVKTYNINIQHFKGAGWNKGNRGVYKKYTPEQYLIKYSDKQNTDRIKKMMIRDKVKECRCEQCGLTSWQEKTIPIELHHINGNNFDFRLKNLLFLCRNCHGITDNFCGKNVKIKNTKRQVYCLDCSKVISRGKRCNSCSQRHRFKDKIKYNKENIIKDIREIGVCKTARKYSVSHTTIRRWSK